MTVELGARGDVGVVFFDVDGTLLDHESAADEAVEKLRAAYRDDLGGLAAEQVRATWKRLQEDWFAEYLNRRLTFVEQRRARVRELWHHAGAARPTAQQCDTVFATYLAAYEDAWRRFPDVNGCLARLGDVPLGVITNGDLDQQQRKLAQLGLTGYFDPVVASSDIGASKPEAEIFIAAARLAGQPVERCVYVGDRMETDANAAATAGMGAVWLNRPQAEGEPGPRVKTITTLAELRI